MFRTASTTSIHRHEITDHLRLVVSITVEDGHEYRTCLDAEYKTSLRGWRAAYASELMCGCIDLDLTYEDLSRDELIDALAERVGALDAGEPLTDYELPEWRMDDDSIDSWAASLGE
jgi:hypothetical protein